MSLVMLKTPLEDQYHQAKRLCLTVEKHLEKLETEENVEEGLEQKTDECVRQLSALVKNMATLVNKESAAKREIWKQRIGEMEEDSKGHVLAFESYMKRKRGKMSAKQEREQRAKLLEGKREAMATMSVNVEEGLALKRSLRAMDDIEATGNAMLMNLATQRERLEFIRRRVLDVMNTLGLSNSVIRFIERRHYTDSRIVYAGMIFCLIVVYLFYWYWKG